jgi:hypothetical protein
MIIVVTIAAVIMCAILSYFLYILIRERQACLTVWVVTFLGMFLAIAFCGGMVALFQSWVQSW